MINLIRQYDFDHWVMDDKITGRMWSSTVPYKNGYIGASRIFKRIKKDRNGKRPNEFGFCEIEKRIYDKNHVLIDSKIIGVGEDPRVFIFKGEPFSFFISFKNENSICEYNLVNLNTEKSNVIKLSKSPEQWEYYGKNFMPLIKNDTLYIIIRLEPELSILKINDNMHDIEWINNTAPTTFPIEVTNSRGGTPFIYNKEKNFYFGLGHRTISTKLHFSFLYTLNSSLTDFTIDNNDIKLDCNYSGIDCVEDPSSIYETDDGYFCDINHIRWYWGRNGSSHGFDQVDYNNKKVNGYGFTTKYKIELV